MPRDPQGTYEFGGVTYGPNEPRGRKVADLDALSPLAGEGRSRISPTAPPTAPLPVPVRTMPDVAPPKLSRTRTRN